jgi:hypothetical protein
MQWKAYKDRQGKSDPHEMMFELELLMNHHSGLLDLDNPLIHEEITI